MHVAIIMDGNRRYATHHKLPTYFGHARGVDNLAHITRSCLTHGVSILTVYALSTENLSKRSEKEVHNILQVMIRGIQKYKRMLVGENVRVKIMGALHALPQNVIDGINTLVDETSTGSKLLLQICLNYGGKDEIVRSINKAIQNGNKTLDEVLINTYLDSDLQPDLIIRPGGEKRLSNFLLWQGAYSELYFTDTFWPDFTEEEFVSILAQFEQRNRRFGA